MAIRWSPRSLIFLLAAVLLHGCERPGADQTATGAGAPLTPPSPTAWDTRGGVGPGDLLGLERVVVPPANVAYSRPGVDFGRFTGFMIEPILIDDPGVLDRHGIDLGALQRMRDTAQDRFTRVLGRLYDVVDKPGPEVLTLRLFLVDLVPIAPHETHEWDDKLTPAFYFGRAEGQAELRDSTTGELLAVIFDPRTPRRATTDHDYQIHRWRHLGFYFREWALQFRGRYRMMRHQPVAS